MDETKQMPEGYVFFQYREIDPTDPLKPAKIRRLPAGTKVAVYRSPSLHPGDVRVLTTYDHPSLYHLVDVVVFPALGARPHPNEMSGGDLDGDIYSVIFDPRLVPKCHVTAMSYKEPPPPQACSGYRVVIDEIKNFFVDYMINGNI